MSDRSEASTSPPNRVERVDKSGDAIAGTVRAQASGIAETTKEAAGKAAEEIKAQGAELLGQAKGRAEDLVDDGKAAGANQASGLARAILHAAEDLEGTSPEVARHVRAAADSLSGIADALRERSAGELLEDVTDFARRQPALFFGAAAIAGFSLVRFARSSAEGRNTAPSRRRGATSSDWATGTSEEAPPPTTMARATLGGAAAYSHGRAESAHMATSPTGPGPAPRPATTTGQSGSISNEKSDFAS